MYFPYFITYMIAGLTLSGLVFAWALATGQFKDQQRARFLALENEAAPQGGHNGRTGRVEIYALGALALAGLGASAAVLLFALLV